MSNPFNKRFACIFQLLIHSLDKIGGARGLSRRLALVFIAFFVATGILAALFILPIHHGLSPESCPGMAQATSNEINDFLDDSYNEQQSCFNTWVTCLWKSKK